MMIFRSGSYVMAAVLLAGASFAARPADAADLSRTFNLKAKVESSCSFAASGASWSQQQNVTVEDPNGSSPTIDFTKSITPTGATNAEAEWKSTASCNVKPSITLASQKGAMISPGLNATPNFTHYLAYQAQASWGNKTVILEANTPNQAQSSGEQLMDGATSGEFRVRFTTKGVQQPFLAGEYSDVVTVTIQPKA